MSLLKKESKSSWKKSIFSPFFVGFIAQTKGGEAEEDTP